MEIKDMNDPKELLRIVIEENREIKNKQSVIKQCKDRLEKMFDEGRI